MFKAIALAVAIISVPGSFIWGANVLADAVSVDPDQMTSNLATHPIDRKLNQAAVDREIEVEQEIEGMILKLN